MADKDQTTATTDDDGGNVEETTGTHESDDRNAETPEQELARLREERKLLGSLQEKAGRVNSLEEKIRQLESDRARNTTDSRGSEVEEQRKQLQEDERYLARLEIAAESGNEDAKVLRAAVRKSVAAQKSAIESEQKTSYRLEMFEIPEARREEIRAFMRDHGVGSPAVAKRLIDGGRTDEMQKEIDRLKAEVEEAKKPKSKAQDTRIVPGRTGSVSNTKSDGSLSLNVSDYNKEMQTPEGRAKIKAARAAGKFNLTAR